jgi:hypothetical protein
MGRLAAAVALLLGALASPAAADQPTWWLSVGGQGAVETGDLRDRVGTEGSALVAAGWHLVSLGDFLIGPEIEGSVGRLAAHLGTVGDDVTTLRGRAGVRVLWWGDEYDEPWLVAYARGGAVYRKDDGRIIGEDGAGWYVGVGFDLRLAEQWWIGPFATYERVGFSIEAKTVLIGLTLTFSY